MAFTRCTNGTFGIYQKYRDPVTGRQRERCLVRLGQFETPAAAVAGYRDRINYLRERVRDINSDRNSRYGYAARHECVLAQFEIDRLRPKLRAVIEYMRAQKRAAEPTPAEQPT
jgi:hypothetical protein